MPNKARNTAYLTQAYAETQPFPEGQETVVYDSELPGFFLRVTKGGQRAWYWRHGQTKTKIGDIHTWNARDARARVIDLRQGAAVGRDILAEERAKADERKAEEAKEVLTAGYCFEAFLKSEPYAHLSEDSAQRMPRLCRRYILSHTKHMRLPLPEINEDHIADFMELAGDNWSARNKIPSIVGAAYKFFRKRDGEIAQSFGKLLTPDMGGLRETPRSKSNEWSREQLRDAYEAAEALDNIWHSGFMRLMILTCRRRTTVQQMRWEDLHLLPNDGPPYWRIPKEFNKKGRGGLKAAKPQSLPLTPRMLAVLDEMPRLGPYVFGGDRPRVASGSGPLKKIRAISGHRYDQDGNLLDFHSLRRSMGTALGAKSDRMVDYVQGRRETSLVRKSYFTSEYLDEQLELLMDWEAYLFPNK